MWGEGSGQPPSEAKAKDEQRPPTPAQPEPPGRKRRLAHLLLVHLLLYWPPLDATSACHQHLMGWGSSSTLGARVCRCLPTVPDVAGLPLCLGQQPQVAHGHTLCAKAGCQPFKCGQVFDHDHLLGESVWLEVLQEPAEDVPKAQPGQGAVLPDLPTEGERDTVLEAGGNTGSGWSGTWVADPAG